MNDENRGQDFKAEVPGFMSRGLAEELAGAGDPTVFAAVELLWIKAPGAGGGLRV